MMIGSQSGLVLSWSCACDDPRNGHELKSRERFNFIISRTELPAACMLLRILMIRNVCSRPPVSKRMSDWGHACGLMARVASLYSGMYPNDATQIAYVVVHISKKRVGEQHRECKNFILHVQ
jgi:hypothetical protein